ncbi:NUDIX hydrolase [Natronorubrum sulfidifaciens]|uniref:NUDIX hydrolase n=1 Tax=Natronorubrum sulfidifaciens JCM 14089 TaxID=1230460 RepID=L9W4Q4_9EURY|nr:NUDIX hydrolase [Natronorubrum sulfidifaciens]ELY44322.1 NUDIX hydrolase [Natronorubrum sulfidifaciens JCM 14089]
MPPEDPLAWKTLDRQVAYTCPGFDVVNESVQLPDGTETEYDYLSEPASVCILPFTPEGDVVCIEEWRQAVSRINRGLPVGGIEPDDDDLEAAARRELAEETGHEAGRLEPLVTVEPANGIADAVLHVFVADGCRPTADQQLDHNESIRVTPLEFETVLEAVRNGEIRDGRAVLAMSYYQLFEGDTHEPERSP